ncbi:MAG: GspH/FimT family pseudopilin [Desulfofustis sp.]|nr:GspH/FimT family pseudopilin [Desulfofustis sp.]
MISKGFTLYELMVVLAILAIVATIGTVSLLGVRERSRLSGLANTIKSDINRGKIIAARNKGYVVLQVSEGYYDLFVDNGAGGATAGNWQREGGEVRISRREIAPSIALTTNFPGDHLRLRSSGRIRPGTFTLAHRSGRRIKVVINAVGRARLELSG